MPFAKDFALFKRFAPHEKKWLVDWARNRLECDHPRCMLGARLAVNSFERRLRDDRTTVPQEYAHAIVDFLQGDEETVDAFAEHCDMHDNATAASSIAMH